MHMAKDSSSAIIGGPTALDKMLYLAQVIVCGEVQQWHMNSTQLKYLAGMLSISPIYRIPYLAKYLQNRLCVQTFGRKIFCLLM